MTNILVSSAFNRAAPARTIGAPRYDVELEKLLGEAAASNALGAMANALYRAVDLALARTRLTVQWGRTRTEHDAREDADGTWVSSEVQYPDGAVATAKLKFPAAKILAKELARYKAEAQATTKTAIEWARLTLQDALDQKAHRVLEKHTDRIASDWENRVDVDTTVDDEDVYQVPTVYFDGKLLPRSSGDVTTKVAGKDVSATITMKFGVISPELVFPGDYRYRFR